MDVTHKSYENMLIHAPSRQWEGDPYEIARYEATSEPPTFSIVIPIFNQESIIYENLMRVLQLTAGTYEMILILDGCTDGSRDKILQWLTTTRLPPTLYLVRVIESRSEMFETSCDNLGFVLSRGTYIIEIQCDMRIQQRDYNIYLTTPLEIYSDMIAVSGRCCHDINYVTPGFIVGKYGHALTHDVPLDNHVYLSHTVNRGPIAFRKTMLKTLGYLDEANYVLGDDDHDLFARAWCQYKWRTGFVPIEYESPLDWGSSRKPKSDEIVSYIKRRHTGQGFFSQHRSTIIYPLSEIRLMSPFRVAVTHARLGLRTLV